VTTKPPVAQRLCWIAAPDTDGLIQCWLLDMTSEGVDILVADTIIIEIKAVEKLLPVHETQLLTYLKLARKRLGFLINFNVPKIRDGIRRLAR